MKNGIVAWLALVIGLCALIWHFVARPLKIGYAETGILMSEFSEAVKAKAQFQEQQKEWDKNLKILNDSLLASMNRMKIQYDGASKAGKDSIRKNFETRNDDYQKYVEAVRKMSQDKERELMDPVIKKINSFLELWGREKGYSLILGTMQGGNILQGDPRYNLTMDILKDLNAHYRDLPVATPGRSGATSEGADSGASSKSKSK
jgi:outer membrane protein